MLPASLVTVANRRPEAGVLFVLNVDACSGKCKLRGITVSLTYRLGAVAGAIGLIRILRVIPVLVRVLCAGAAVCCVPLPLE